MVAENYTNKNIFNSSIHTTVQYNIFEECHQYYMYIMYIKYREIENVFIPPVYKSDIFLK